MAALPSSPQSKLGSELKNAYSNEASRRSEDDGVKSGHLQNIRTVSKASTERHAGVDSQSHIPGTYYIQANEARGKHMVHYVYANLRDPNDESLPFHIREKYKELQRERLRGYQQALSPRGTSPSRQHGATNHHFGGNKLPRPASARYERRLQNIPNDIGSKPGKYAAEVARQVSSAKSNQKTAAKNIQETRSSNAVLGSKRGTRSRSKTSSPRPRRPFSMAAESTSDTDPIENQRSTESVPHRSPPRVSGSRNVRREKYLATKFKLAARNSKHTQTFVAAVASVEESSESATTVVSRHHSITETEVVDKSDLKSTSSQPYFELENKLEGKHMNEVSRDVDAEKPASAPQNVAKGDAVLSALTEKGHESLEWKRAKLRLRSTPRSPSPPLQESQPRVASADRVRPSSKEKPFGLAGGRAASGHNGLVSDVRSLTPPASERRFVSSATQIEDRHTTDTGVQVKLKKNRSPSQRQARKERRSPSLRSVVSKVSSQSGSKGKEENVKVNKNKTKRRKQKTKSRDPSIRSLRSLRSFQSDASTGILKHVKIVNSATSRTMARGGRSSSAAALRETTTKKKKSKVKRKKSSSKIARFLRTLSKDKEAINVISKMAAMQKKKTNK